MKILDINNGMVTSDCLCNAMGNGVHINGGSVCVANESAKEVMGSNCCVL